MIETIRNVTDSERVPPSSFELKAEPEAVEAEVIGAWGGVT